MLNFKKPAVLITIIALIIAGTALALFLSNPADDRNNTNNTNDMNNTNYTDNTDNTNNTDNTSNTSDTNSTNDISNTNNTNNANNTDELGDNSLLVSEMYKVSLKYPSTWQLKAGYYDRYEGTDGFFQLSALNGEGLSIDEAAELDAFHILKPYGSEPQIKNIEIDKQEARLILPSEDQPEGMQNQAGLIVKYPKAVKIDGSTYHYFILWADAGHIEEIGRSISFK